MSNKKNKAMETQLIQPKAVRAKLLELREMLIKGEKWPRLPFDPTVKRDSCADRWTEDGKCLRFIVWV